MPGRPINVGKKHAVWTDQSNVEDLLSQQSFFYSCLTINIFHDLGNLLSFQIPLFMLKAQICSWFSCCIPVDQNWAQLLSLSVPLLSREGNWNTFLVRRESVDAGRAPVSSLSVLALNEVGIKSTDPSWSVGALWTGAVNHKSPSGFSAASPPLGKSFP